MTSLQPIRSSASGSQNKDLFGDFLVSPSVDDSEDV